MSRYYMTPSYRLAWTDCDGERSENWGGQRSAAMDAGRRLLRRCSDVTGVRVESLDDRYPANVVETWEVKP